jgi:shikimate kinase
MNIILCGYQGCGKSTIAKAFAKKMNYHYIDTDSMICEHQNSERNTHRSVREIYHLLGESTFRELEKSLVRSIKCPSSTIIATGGGVLMHLDNAEYLKSLGKMIYLSLAPEVILSRMLQKDTLPNFIRETHLQEDFDRYIESRKDMYESHCDTTINVSNKTVEEIVFILNQYRCDHGQ